MLKPERAVWILAAFYFFFNIGFLSYEYDFDGVVFSLQLEFVKAGTSWPFMLHPHHLLYEPLGYLFWNLLSFVGWKVRSIIALEIFDLVLGSISLAVFARGLQLLEPRKKWLALVCALGLGFCYAYWHFSVEPEVYILSVLFLNLAFYAMLRTGKKVQETGLSNSNKIIFIILLSLLSTMVITGHLVHGLFGIPIIYFAVKTLGGSKGRSKIAPAFWVVICSGVFTGSIYISAFLLNPLTAHKPATMPRQFKNWLLDLAASANNFGYPESYWNASLSAPVLWLKGMAWAFSNQIIQGPGHFFRKLLIVFCLLILAGYFFAFLIALARNRGRGDTNHILILLWLITGAAFSVLWAPGWYEQKMYILPAVWAAVYLGVPDSSASRLRKFLHPALVFSAVSILFLVNFIFEIFPGSIPENNQELKAAYQMREATPRGSVIVISGLPIGYNIGKFYIPYFADRWAFTLDWRLSEPIRGKLFPQNTAIRLEDYARQGRAVYLLSDVLQEKIAEELARRHGLKRQEFDAFWAGYDPKPAADLGDGLKLYLLNVKSAPSTPK